MTHDVTEDDLYADDGSLLPPDRGHDRGECEVCDARQELFRQWLDDDDDAPTPRRGDGRYALPADWSPPSPW